jgi:hypothetical protein
MKSIKEKLPSLLHNWTSAFGFVIALISSLVVLFLLVITSISSMRNPYTGIILYMILPAFLAAGLALIPLGVYMKWRSPRKQGELPFKWPSIDFNDSRQRNAALIFVLGTLFLIMMSTVGIYQAYQFTDSVTFCGKTCHTVMKPEYTAYQISSHAHVKCVECHIGPGVGWYAKSKLSGLYQVYAVIAGDYSRPIPTPIANLRPARETCEECHWPKKFYGALQRNIVHYEYDMGNSRWPITMLLKVGSGTQLTSRISGIHWHINPGVTVEYVAKDERRQVIPWVKVSDKVTGKVSVYRDPSGQGSADKPGYEAPRVMDCMDCHNRPSHSMRSPDYSIDLALAAGRINPNLPEIKRIAVASMTKRYSSEKDAIDGISSTINDFYRTQYPRFYNAKKASINDAVKATQTAFKENIFPSMKARWSDYPNNAGHFIFPGCMRCHDGKHKSDDGKAIPSGCNTCHVILRQGKGGPVETVNLNTGQEFRHPVDIGGAWKETGCSECHSGVQP